ncbi:MAG TPA: PadR family transcriptional regulator [Gemmatimonadaceae bacterium]|jgi:transcriptional regulator
MRSANDMLHGTLDVLILRALAWSPMHGYALANWIGERASGELEIADAALYKALHRLEASGAIDAHWGLSENNRRAKYYSLSPRGRKVLTAELETWRRFARAVAAVLEPADTRGRS